MAKNHYVEGGLYELGCGFYKLRRTKSGLLKAETYSRDDDCVKRHKADRKKRIARFKKKG